MPRSKPSSFLNELLKREYKDNTTRLSKKIFNDRLKFAQNLYNKNFLAHYGCVNAIEFLNGGQFLASGGDDRRVLLWNVHEALQGVGSPHAMRAQHVSNIFCLGYDSKNTKLFSAGNDDQVIVHDLKTGDPVDFFLYEQPIYGLSVDPCNDDVFVCACDDGAVLLYDIRAPAGTEPFLLARSVTAFHGVMYNPVESRLIATANAKDGACLWDTRKPREPLLKYGFPHSCMSVRWNSTGTQILALRRRMPPVLYGVESPEDLAQFDHPGYFNSCTMKSCCFAGYDDEYVLSGSDDFNLYMWKIPPLENKGQWVSSAHIVLGGHRSIVNQVRFNPDNNLIASSGVEKLIKVWSPFHLPLSSGGLELHSLSNKRRRVFSHEEYITLVMRSGQIISHDYSQESTKEDPRMMAFFDSLVQREIEGWSSDESPSDTSPVYSEHSVPDSEDNDDHNDDDDEDDDNDNDNDNNIEEDNDGDGNSVSIGNENNNANGTGGLPRRRKNYESNPIVKLIAKKRAQLMRLAKNNNQTMKRNSSCCSKKLNSCNSNNTSSSSSNSSTSSSSKSSISSSNSSASSYKNNNSSSSNNSICSMTDSSNDSESSTTVSKGKKRKKHRYNKLTRNKRKRVNYLDNLSSFDTEDENDDGEENNNENFKGKKKLKTELNSFKIRKVAIKFSNSINYKNNCDNKNKNIPETNNSSSTVLEDTPTTSLSHLRDDLNTTSSSSSSTTPDSQRVREVETQDSGIFLSDFNSSNNNNNVSILKKSSKSSHRNYRKHVVNSDDSDD